MPRPGSKQSPPALAPDRVTSCFSALATPASGDAARPRVVNRSATNRPVFIAGQSGGAAENAMAPSHQPAAPSSRASAKAPPTS